MRTTFIHYLIIAMPFMACTSADKAEISEEKATVAMGASARWKPIKWISLGAMYSVNERSAANLGLHLVVKPGPIQVYFASDNVLNAFSIKNSPAVNLRTGLSLIF